MPLKDIQLCHIDPIDRVQGTFTVTAWSEDGDHQSIFKCDSEADAIKLRDAIRDHATKLLRVYRYDA